MICMTHLMMDGCSPEGDGGQPAKKARPGRVAGRMKPAKYIEVDSTSGSDEGGSMFVDDD